MKDSLSSDAYEYTSTIMALLETMKNAAQQLIKAARMASGGEYSSHSQDDLEGLHHSLHAFNQTTLPLLKNIERQGQDLSHDLDQTLKFFHVQTLFTSEIEADLAGLQSISGETQTTDKANSMLCELECAHSRYTMFSEREIHEFFAGAENESSMGKPAGNNTSKKADPDELGDNVELF